MYKNKIFSKSLFFFFLFFIYTNYSFAIGKLYSLQELCIKSDHIIKAKVISIESFYHGGNKKIFSSIKFKVDEIFKGDYRRNEIFEIIQYGGTLDGKTSFAVGSESFKVGQTSIIFLKEYISDEFGRNYGVWSKKQGKFNITDNKVTREIDFPLELYPGGQLLPITKTSAMSESIFISKINIYK